MKRLFLFSVLALSGIALWAQVNVTFKVDMTGVSVSADGVHLAGSLNGWSTTATPMADLGNNVYGAPFPLTPATMWSTSS